MRAHRKLTYVCLTSHLRPGPSSRETSQPGVLGVLRGFPHGAPTAASSHSGTLISSPWPCPGFDLCMEEARLPQAPESSRQGPQGSSQPWGLTNTFFLLLLFYSDLATSVVTLSHRLCF